MKAAGSCPGDSSQNGMRYRDRKQNESRGPAHDVEMVTIRHSGFSSMQNRAASKMFHQRRSVSALDPAGAFHAVPPPNIELGLRAGAGRPSDAPVFSPIPRLGDRKW